MPDRPIILIGGAPTAGKSSVAEALARRLDLPWMSTDQLRDVMRIVASRADHPTLFNPEGYDAERFHAQFDADEVVAIEYRQAEAAWPGIRHLIRHDYTWTRGFILEGVSLFPHLIAADCLEPNVKAVFLVDKDPERARKVIFERGLWSDAPNYPDAVKEKEVAWVGLLAERLRADALKAGYPVVAVEKNDGDLPKVLAALQLSSRPA